MTYNVCGICGAKDGKAGMLIGNEVEGLVHACMNCDGTRTTGTIVIHANLIRTPEEIEKTFSILSNNLKIDKHVGTIN